MRVYVIAITILFLAFILLCVWACLRVSGEPENVEITETINNSNQD